MDEERLDNVPSYSGCSGGGAIVTSLWAWLRATPIICARMTIGKIAPRGQRCRHARHGAAGQHVNRAASDPSILTITEKAPTRAWLKAPTCASFKTLFKTLC